MKRIILIIGALLLGLAARAQLVTYTCRYWFDENFAQATTTTFSASTWQAELDVGSLTEGLHALHLHVMDTSMKWSAPQSYLFLKLAPPASLSDFTYYYWFDQDHASMQSCALGDGHLLLDVDDLSEGLHAIHVMLKGGEYSTSQTYLFLKADAWESGTPNYVYHCWFDDDFANQQTDVLGSGHLLLDVVGLEDGVHSVHVLVEGSTLTTTQSYLFMKVTPFAADSIDMTHLSYHCWFDEDFEHQQIDSLGDGHLLLDVNDLEDGLHTVHVMLQGSTLTATQSYMFMKMAVEDPSTELQYICWFDQDYGSAQTGPLGDGLFELEVSELPNGIHTVNVQLSNGTRTAPQCYLFYKQPLGGYGIARWEYWLNDDIANRQITNISPTVDTLDIISLLNVGHPALRSSCFHFHPNGDAPYINAKNEISFRFWDSEMRFIDKSAYYVDEQVQQDIVATVFERNTTETFAAPRNNQIQWFKMEAGAGDFLAFATDKACTIQLFAPSGEEVYTATASEAMILDGCNTWEDGIYYLAVHDVTGSGETVDVTYQYVYKYAVLACNVHQIGNGGCSTITIQGNGFNSLLDVYLVNSQNDTIRRLDIDHKSNTTSTITFDFYQVNLGAYDAVFQFVDEEVRVLNAVQVEEPTAILLTNSVSYPHSFMSGTPVKYSYTITNHGNMSAYKIPIFIHVSTLNSGNVTSIRLDGLNLPSLLDGISTDSLSAADALQLKQLSDKIGDLHHFFAFKTVDENTGDSIRVLSNYFFINLAPLESKVVDVIVTAKTGAHKPLNVWLTVPNDTVQPLVISERGIRDQYCCVKDKIECVLNITSDISELLSKIPGGWGVAAHITDCAASTLSTLSSSIGYWVCRDEGGPSLDDYFALEDSKDSYVSLIMDCFKKFLPKGLKQIMTFLDDGGSDGLEKLLGIWEDIDDCVTAFTETKPDCPPGDDEGGSSDGQTPGDPNDIRGYLSESGSHYMRQEIQNVQYEIEFENDTTLATAAAHTIIVRDTLDATKFDLNSLAARSVTIGDKRLELNGEQTFARTLDLRPEIYVIAQIEQDYDPAIGIVEWTIQSLDPMTMEPTDDPNQGVLPVNYNGKGVGFIDYSINLKEAFADGTEISNRAGIIFDQEDIIMTPTWTNIVDAVKPTSHIEEVTFEDDTLNFNFVSSDSRSGVWYHNLYYRNETTEQEWKVKVPKILENYCLLHFDEYQTTEYLVMAVDSAGNVEDKEMVAEYIHYYDGPAPVTQTINLSQGWNWISTYIESSNLLEQLETNLGSNGIEIWSNSNSTEYDEEWGWFGDLDDIGMTNEEMYMVKTKTSCSMQLQGLPANPANYAITINPGWNWIGFPCNGETTLEEALSNFEAEQGDQIWSSSFSTEYDDGWGWFGDIDTLVPGEGYMYYSNSTQPKTLIFQTGSKAK